MSEDLAKLKVKIEGDASGMKKEMQKALQISKSTNESIKKEFSKATRINIPTNSAFEKLKSLKQKFKDAKREFQINAGIRIPTEEYARARQNVQDMEEALKRLREEEEALQDLRKDEGLSEKYYKVKKSADEAQRALDKLLKKEEELEDSGKAMEINPAYQKTMDSWNQEEKHLENLYKEVERRKAKNIPLSDVRTDGTLYNLEDEIKKAESSVERFEKKIDSLKAKGKKYVPTAAAKRLSEQIENATEKVGKYKTELASITSEGLKYGTDEWIKNQKEIEKTSQKLSTYQQICQNLEKSNNATFRYASIPKAVVTGLGIGAKGLLNFGIGSIMKGWGGLVKFLKIAKVAMMGLGTVIKRTSGLFAALIKKFSTGIPIIRRFTSATKKNGNSFGGSLKNILKYSLGIRSLFALMNRLRGALTEGFKNLAQYSGQTNASISMLMSSLTQLKNAFAAAFAPILNAVAPILNTLIQKVISVVNALGQLTSALTGKGSYIRAKKVNQDYAASLNNNAKNAVKAKKANEDLKRTLLGFDQINKLDGNNSFNDDTGTDGTDLGGLSPGDMFETLGIENKYKDLANKIKEAWRNADFTEIGAIVGRKLNEALQNIPWDRIQETANRIAKSIATFLNGFIETADWGLVGNTIAQGINTAFGFANTFAQNFHWGSLGEAIGNGINGALNGIDWNTINSTAYNWGRGVAEALNGAVSTTDWNLLGKSLANGLNAAFLYTQAFATTFDWSGLGTAFGNGINGALLGLDWNLIRSTVTTVTTGLAHSLNSAISTIDWGLAGWSFGQGVNTVIDFAYSAVTTFDWAGIGIRISEFINSAVSIIEWNKAGEALSNGIKGLLNAIHLAISGTDWKSIGTSIGGFLNGIDWKGIIYNALSVLADIPKALFDTISGAIKTVDWKSLVVQIGTAIKDFLVNHDWKADFTSAGELIGTAFKSLFDVGSTIMNGIKDCGKNIVEGLKGGIVEYISGIGNWIQENIFKPFMSGFKSAFGIHSPSTVMAEMGEYLMEGLIQGIKGLAKNAVNVFSGIGRQINETWETAKTNAGTIWEEITEKVGGFWDFLTGKSQKDFPSMQKDVEDSFSNVKKTSETEWGDSYKAVTGALSDMERDTKRTMGNVMTIVQSYWKSVVIDTNSTWELISKKINKELGNAVHAAGESTSAIANAFSGLGTRISDRIGDLSGVGQRAARSILTGFQSAHVQNGMASEFSGIGNRISSAIGSLYSIGHNAAQSFANGFQSVRIQTPHIYASGYDYFYYGNGGTISIPQFSVQWYAKGGFPSNGEMFIANENGPELVGKMGNRNTVANNNQIVEGIKSGVFEAVMDALEASYTRDQGPSDKEQVMEFTLIVDSETAYKIVRKGKRKYDGRHSVIETI